jgi:hypothetical protein
MKAIFYDRKNKREVSSEELMSINFTQTFATVDSDDATVPTGRRICPESGERMNFTQFADAFASGHFDQLAFVNHTPDWYSWEEEKNPLALFQSEQQISSLGYKDDVCPDYLNWNLHCNLQDLIFLRLED